MSEKPVSSKPRKKEKLESKKLSKEDFEAKVVELSKKGLTSEKIGELLRREGIHSKEHNVKISKILKARGTYVQPDLKNVSTKLDKIRSHSEKNKQDKRAKRELVRVSAQLRKLNHYHKVA